MTRVLLLPTLLLILLFVAGFVASSPSLSGPDAITFINSADVVTLDPHGMSWAQDIRTAMGLWEGLCAYDPHTLAPIPGVAESWEISKDGLTYTFHLRADAKWSNGETVTAQDFAASWKRGMDPKYNHEYLALFYHLQGAEAYADLLAKDPAKADFSTVGVKAADQRTLVVTLGQPCTFFLDLVAFPTFYPLNLASMKAFANDDSPRPEYSPKWTHPPNLVTNGPYQLTQWVFKQYLMLEPNPYYWDRGNVHCSRLKLVAYESGSEALLAYQSGTADVMSYLPPEFGEHLITQEEAGKRDDVHYIPVFGTYYYVFNCQKKPFDDARVREAFSLVVDKPRIVNDVTKMRQRVVNVIVPKGYIAGYESPMGLEMNVGLAKKLLAEAGYPEGKGFPTVDFLYNNAAPHKDVAEAIAQMWEQQLGVHLTYRGVDIKAFHADRQSAHFDIARGGWYGDYMDPTTWLDLCRSNNDNNDGHYSNPAFDALMEKADGQADPAQRFATLKQAEDLLVTKEFPLLPLYQYGDGSIFDAKKIGGIEPNVRMLTELKWIRRLAPAGGS